jgi:hypothetical protein
MRNSQTWFDDELINSYIELLKLGHPRVGFLPSYFMAHQNSSSWTTTKQVIQDFKQGLIDIIILPTHLSNHWTLLVASRSYKFYLFDSLQKTYPELTASFQQWLEQSFPEKSWTLFFPFQSTSKTKKPHQKDSYNCGPFVCLYAKMLSQRKQIKEIDTECHKVNISQFREEVLSELCENISSLHAYPNSSPSLEIDVRKEKPDVDKIVSSPLQTSQQPTLEELEQFLLVDNGNPPEAPYFRELVFGEPPTTNESVGFMNEFVGAPINLFE